MKLIPITSLAFFLYITVNVSAAFAESGNENRDSYYVKQFDKFNQAFEMHIGQLEKCIAEMEMFEKEDTGLVFNDVECSKLDKMRPEAQDLYEKTRSALEEYYGWISSLTEDTFRELVKYSTSSQSMLLESTRKYLTKHKEAVAQSERIMQKQVRRLEEMEQRIKQAEQQIDSTQEEDNSEVGTKSN